MHPLDGPRLKIRRAVSEIQRLRRAEEAFGRDAGYRLVRAEFNKESRNYVYRVCAGRTPDLDWGIYIGEIAHNLRSALDGLIYQLVLWNRETPTSHTQFPIFLVGHTKRRRTGRRTLIPHFEGMELADGRSMIEGVDKRHQAAIERLQPYKRGTSAAGHGRNNALFLLKELNNADKHRLLQVVSVRSGTVMKGAFNSGFSSGFDVYRPQVVMLKDGAKILEAPPSVQVDTNIMPLIAFWKGCDPVKNRVVHLTLRRIAEHVSEIVESFGPEFGKRAESP